MASNPDSPQPPAEADASVRDQLRRRLDDLRQRLDTQAQRHARLEAMLRVGQWEWAPESGAWWHSAGLRALLRWPLNRPLDRAALRGRLDDTSRAALGDAGTRLRKAAGTWEARISLRDFAGQPITVDWRMESTPLANGTLVLRGVLVDAAPARTTAPEDAWRGTPIRPAMLHGLIDAIPHPLAVRDPEGNYLKVNGPMATLFGLTPGQMEGRNIRDLLRDHPALLARNLAEDEQVLRTRETLRLEAVPVAAPNGRHIHLDKLKFPVRAPDGGVIGVGAVCEDVTAQVRTARDLEQTRGLLQAVFDVVPVAISVTDADGRYLMANRLAARFAGWRMEEMIGRTVRDAPQISDAMKAEVERINRELLDGHVTEVSGEHQTRRGEAQRLLHFHRHLVALRDHAGKPYAVVTAYVDTTAQRHREQQLRRGEARFHGIFDNAGFGISVMNLEQEILLANPAMHHITGHAPGALVGKAFWEITHPDDVRLLMEKTELLRRQGGQTCLEYEQRIVKPVGETVWARCRVSSLTDEQGAVDSVFAIVEDITAQRRREAELQLSRARFHSIFDHASTGILVTSPDGTILMANPAMGRMIDYAPADLVGRTIESITHPRDVQRHAMSMASAQPPADGGHRVIEQRYLTPGGRIVWARVTISAVADEAGQPDFVVGIVENITPQHELNRSLRNVPGPDVARPDAPPGLTGTPAADLETVLARIAAAAGDLLRDGPAEAGEREPLTEMARAAADGAALLRRLSTAPAGDSLRMGVMNLRQVCERLVQELTGGLPAGIRLETRLDAETACCGGDAEMMAQALRNLLANAVDAMPEGGTITLSLDKVSPGPPFYASHPKLALGKYWRLRVGATGRGIGESARAHVFDPFHTTHRRQDRPGLGLAMVRSVIDRHAGVVELESSQGQGTTVSLFLPAMAHGAWRRRAPSARAAGRTVLLVSEDTALRDRVRSALAPLGCALRSVGNDVDAVMGVLQEPHEVALVLLHDAMRAADQGAVHARLQRSAPGLPVLFVTDGDALTVAGSDAAGSGAPRGSLDSAVRRLMGR